MQVAAPRIGGCQPTTSNPPSTVGGGETKDGEKTGNVLPGGPRDKLAGHGPVVRPSRNPGSG